MKHFATIAAFLLSIQLISAELDFQSTSLDVHNELRRKHVDTPDLVMDEDLNRRAQQCAEYYAHHYHTDHSCPHKNGAGENLFKLWTTGDMKDGNEIATLAARAFHNEHKVHDWDNPKASHFTQLVWIKSTMLGTGFAVDKEKKDHYLVNLYRAHGNVVGQLKENVNKFKEV